MVRTYLIALLILLNSSIYARLVSIDNENVIVTVDNDTSGFYFFTVGGDPDLSSDDNRNLLFLKSPPTSTTFISVDDNLTYFGSYDGYYIQRAEFENGRINATWSYKGLEIVQIIELIKGPSTGRKDSIRISYFVRNVSGKAHKVRIEIILDTCLGDRDGIRFALDNGKILSKDTVFTNRDVPEYAYAFSSIENPVARIQCTFKSDKILINPDKVVFSSWRKIFDDVFDFEPGGEPFATGPQFDSGVGIIYPEQNIDNNNPALFSTIFGIYGANVYTNDLFALSLSSSKVVSNTPFTISLNVMNKTAKDITNGKILLILPEELRLTGDSSGKVEYTISNFHSSNIMTISYQVQSANNLKAIRNSAISVKIEADVNGSNVILQSERKFVIMNTNANLNWLNLTETENKTLARFPSGSAELTDEIKKILDKTVDSLKALPGGTRVLVTGYTDNVGDPVVNAALGKKRAEAVVTYLKDYYKLEQITFITESGANEKPVADNTTEKGKEQNRRVEFTLLDD